MLSESQVCSKRKESDEKEHYLAERISYLFKGLAKYFADILSAYFISIVQFMP